MTRARRTPQARGTQRKSGSTAKRPARRRRAARGGHDSVATRWLVLILAGTIAVAIAGIVAGPRVVRQMWSRVGVRHVEAHAETIRAAAAESRIDPCLLAGVMYAESRGDLSAVSNKGALGLFQLMPDAASDSARRLKLPPPTRDALLSDELLNARLAADHLRWLIETDGPDLERVLVEYNAGRAKLVHWARDAGSFSAWREQHVRDQDSGALTYALEVLEFRDRFRARGVIAPDAPEGSGSVAEVPAAK